MDFKRLWYPKEIVIQAIYLKLRYPLSYRDIEEILSDRGINVDHATIQRWVVKYTPYFDKKFRKKKLLVGSSWRMDETYIKVKGVWMYYYRAVDKECPATITFPLQRQLMDMLRLIWK